MGKSTQKKGNDLEKGIELIETTILKAEPKLSEKSYQIYSKKIFVVEDVKHEIDIWVEFDIGGGYKSIFIFEAKNWNKTIGKNEPIILSEKIKAAKAQQGFLVGKQFSKYAVAAAKRDSRITLLKVSDSFPLSQTISSFISRFHCMHVNRNKMHVHVELEANASSTALPNPIDIVTVPATINGVTVNIQNYVLESASRLIEAHNNKLPTHNFADGVYEYDLSHEILFQDDKLVISTSEIIKLVLRMHYQIEIIRPPIVSQYEISTRGRIYNLEAISKDGITTKVGFVETFKQQ